MSLCTRVCFHQLFQRTKFLLFPRFPSRATLLQAARTKHTIHSTVMKPSANAASQNLQKPGCLIRLYPAHSASKICGQCLGWESTEMYLEKQTWLSCSFWFYTTHLTTSGIKTYCSGSSSSAFHSAWNLLDAHNVSFYPFLCFSVDNFRNKKTDKKWSGKEVIKDLDNKLVA